MATAIRGFNRLQYFLGLAGFFVAMYGLVKFIDLAPGELSRVLVLPLLIALLVLWIFILVRRIQNTGYSGWWALTTLIPIGNLLVVWFALALPPGFRTVRVMDRNGYLAAAAYLLFWIVLVYAATYVPDGPMLPS